MSDSQNAEYMEHAKTWRGFTRFVNVGIALVVIILVGMALSLL